MTAGIGFAPSLVGSHRVSGLPEYLPFEIGPADPATLAKPAILIVAAALIAGAPPARPAARVAAQRA